MRRTIFLMLGLALGMSVSLAAAAAPSFGVERVPPPVMDDKPLRLGSCDAVGEVRQGDRTLVVFKCPESGATVFVPRENVEVPFDAPLQKGERDL